MTRRARTTLQRARIFNAHNGICGECKGKIDGVREGFDLDHIIPLALGGEDEESNLHPVHRHCHKEKTKGDVKAIAKSKRVAAKHQGAKASRNPLPGSRGSKWKAKIGGGWERRET